MDKYEKMKFILEQSKPKKGRPKKEKKVEVKEETEPTKQKIPPMLYVGCLRWKND